ncbi:hypothetical protein C8Q79DRAFT_239397 [Trametes meyenii]|nr:hypothetical protein C8Q79DRAFT_239397 [Trametes meyenii]
MVGLSFVSTCGPTLFSLMATQGLRGESSRVLNGSHACATLAAGSFKTSQSYRYQSNLGWASLRPASIFCVVAPSHGRHCGACVPEIIALEGVIVLPIYRPVISLGSRTCSRREVCYLRKSMGCVGHRAWDRGGHRGGQHWGG